jgi:uncharacterized repeat protein (TIGR01451 family)
VGLLSLLLLSPASPAGATPAGTPTASNPDLQVGQGTNPQQAFVPGGVIDFGIWVRNGGGGDAHNVYLTDTLPASLTFITSTVAYPQQGGPPTEAPFPYNYTAGNSYVWQLGTLTPSQEVHFVLRAFVTDSLSAGDEVVNQLSVSTSDTEGGGGASNNFSTFTVTLVSADLTGVIHDPTGNPVGNVKVFLDNDQHNFHQQTYSGSSTGGFAFGGLQADTYRLAVDPGSGSPWAPPDDRVVQFSPPGPMDVGVITLTQPQIIGQVMDPSGSSPVGNVWVEAHTQDNTLSKGAGTGSDGRFRLGGLPDGVYTLVTYPAPDSPYTPSIPRAVTVTAQNTNNVGIIRLTRPLIFGRVTLPDGTTGVPDAWVDAETLDHTFHQGAGSDSQGNFKIGGLLTSTTYLLRANPPTQDPAYANYSQSDEVQVTLGSQPITLSKPLLLTQVNVRGRVLDPNGQPTCCVGVDVFNADFSIHRSTGTDTDGTFRLGGLSPTTYTLEVYAPWGKSWLRPAPLPFVITDSAVIVDVGDVQFATPSKTVQGLVMRSGTGAGVPDVEVHANKRGARRSSDTSTNSSGHFSLGVSGGTWEVMISPPHGQPVDWVYDGHPQIVQFADDSTPETKVVTFTVVSAETHVVGSVRGPNGQMLSHPEAVWIEVRDTSGQGNGGPLRSDGTFDVPVLAGTYNLWVHLDDRQYPDWGSPTLAPFAVSKGVPYDVGEVRLVAKTSHIAGRVIRSDTGQGIASAEIHAWKPQEGGWANTFSAADGSFSLSVISGTWDVAVQPPDGSSYVTGQPPQRVTVGDNQTISNVTFSLVEAAGTILGTVRDINGAVLTDVDGWAYARQGNSPEPTAGGELRNGAFSIRVPPGSYNVGVWLPPDSGYTLASEQPVGPMSIAGLKTSGQVAMATMAATEHRVKVASGSTKGVTITLLSQNAWIVGGFFTDTAKTHPATGVQGEVFAMNGMGGTWQGSSIDPTSGRYRLHVAAQPDGTTWNLGYWLRSADYVNSPPPDSRVTIRPGETFTMNFTIVAADASITGTIQKPDGTSLAHAFAWAHRQRTPSQAGLDTGDDSDTNGSFNIRVPAGTYDVGAYAPEEWGYIQPQVITSVVAPTGGLVLQFKNSNATITGTVYYHQEGGQKAYGPWAWVWAWSDSGAHTGALTNKDGVYRLNVITGTTWHIGATYQANESFFYDTITDTVLAITDSVGGVDLEIYPNQTRMPPAASTTFSATVGTTIVLSDGTKVEIPAGAMPVTGTVRLAVVPMVEELPNTLTARPFGWGYGIYAYDSSGKQIVSKFNKNVYLTFYYSDAELAKRGVSEDNLSPAYFSTTTNSWTKAAVATHDKASNQIKVQIDHFSTWGMVSPQAEGGSQAYQKVYMPLITKSF